MPALLEALEEAFAASDAVVSVGGVSMGAERDLLRPALAKMGLEETFWKVAQKPGKPMAFGRLGRKLWFGLPGNPVSSWVCFLAYAAPALRRMAGRESLGLGTLRATFEGEPFATPGPLAHFLRCRLEASPDGRLAARLAGGQGSDMVSALPRCDALLVVPPEAPEAAPGDVCEAIPADLGRCAAAMARVLAARDSAAG
jgi:molybdopterin molybdotransferase